ncbi:hypothetical protein CONPUDRAFT_42338, partial [Coniophora puteana RWD-64-598 SS2]
KRANQWRTWSDKVLPDLIRPYLAYLKASNHFHRSADITRLTAARSCSANCHGFRRRVEVTCLEPNVTIESCSCTPVPVRLVNAGFFPCAPTEPSLAVDMRLLQFITMLSVRTPPNVSAWSDTLESFLLNMGHKLEGKGNLRRRFQRAFHWYRVLVRQSDEFMQSLLVKLTPPRKDQPTQYLRERCPLCFGGNDWRRGRRQEMGPDVIVCIDACFTQKRSNGHRLSDDRDPPNPTKTVFLSEEMVADAERMVNNKRPPRTRKRQAPSSQDEDVIEDGMRIPSSVLDGCGESFIAADEKRSKASTQFFSDTGLMALLCRHDQVLWLVNMTSSGEKQHYALALIIELFNHLPADMNVGLLYDIGCQLERSCRNFSFIPELLPRIVFAISVFHAYGHQWPCQIVYHPWKCPGFGFSDGEGCERLWSALKLLIPSLRVSGFYQRLFALDVHVSYLDVKSLENIGHWLQRRWKSAQQRLSEASRGLRATGVAETVLRVQWRDQVIAQTRPLPRQSSGRAEEDVLRIIELEKTYEKARETLLSSEAQLASGGAVHLIDTTLNLEEERARCGRLKHSLSKLKAALGLEGRRKLGDMRRNKYLHTRMKALALKTRIRDKLRHRKFELSKLERAYRQTLNEQRLHDHTAQSVKRKEPSIAQLVKRYNDLVIKLKKIKDDDRSLSHVVVPHFINSEGIFALDVDDNIWEDVGLHEGEANPPAWLGNEKVREGIRHMLAYDRSVEEVARLSNERARLQEWTLVTWSAL